MFLDLGNIHTIEASSYIHLPGKDFLHFFIANLTAALIPSTIQTLTAATFRKRRGLRDPCVHY
jgi:hypothetical protein